MKTKLLILFLSVLSLTAFAQREGAQLVQQITSAIDAVDATLPQINILIKKGEKGQAKTLIEKTLRQIETVEADYKRLAQMNDAENADVPSVSQLQETKRYLTNKANQLRYTNVYLRCEAKLFEGEYGALLDAIQSALSEENVSFVDSANVSDWTVTITAKAREYNKAEFGGMTTYFAYVDAKTVIVKTATGKRLQENSVTEKGGSPISYEQAAREAYKYLAPRISAIIKEQIEK